MSLEQSMIDSGRGPRFRLSRKAVLAALVVGCMGAVLLLSRDPGSTITPVATPEQLVSAMIEAEQRGNLAGYLDCFGGALREKLENQAAQEPGDRFRTSLMEETAGLKAFVTRDRVEEESGDVQFVLERIFAERNEQFRVRARVLAGRWQIVELSAVGRDVPEIPYGTPVYATSQDTADRPSKPPESPNSTGPR